MPSKPLLQWALKLGLLKKEGGKHTKLIDPKTGRRVTVVPRGRTLKKGTFHSIEKRLVEYERTAS